MSRENGEKENEERSESKKTSQLKERVCQRRLLLRILAFSARIHDIKDKKAFPDGRMLGRGYPRPEAVINKKLIVVLTECRSACPMKF